MKGRVGKPLFSVAAPRVRYLLFQTLQFELATPGRRAQVFHLGKPDLEEPGEVAIFVHLGYYSQRPQAWV